MILYFSGSGNSLAIARQLSTKLNDRVVSLYDAVNEDLSREECIGLVFPTYWLDAPLAVKELIPKIKFPATAYTYIVITCGAQTNNAIWSARKLLRLQGVEISYCHKVRVPDSCALAFGRNPNSQSWKFDKYANRVDEIASDIKNCKHSLHYSAFDPFAYIVNSKSLAGKLYKITTPIVNPDKCIGCETCYKICPQNNIKISDSKAFIGDNCTFCFGCVHFCPSQAIDVSGKPTSKEFQYHHPQISLKDMLKR
jgi:ferredoxin